MSPVCCVQGAVPGGRGQAVDMRVDETGSALQAPRHLTLLHVHGHVRGAVAVCVVAQALQPLCRDT